ncbi:MAG: hypothetical protein IJN43_02905 [Ruminococcus sp.]|nr:hypothetical protein [Ruminococcus sp.]
MICSACGTENESGFKFCVKCGSNMENPSEINYEAVDRGNYHSEEDSPENAGGFTLNEDTFIIRDVPAPAPRKQLYTSDELNSSEEEFDFSMFDEPSMASLPTPPVPPQPVAQPNMQSAMPQMPQQMQQPMMYGQPQIIGYDQSGKPIYGQPPMQQQMQAQQPMQQTMQQPMQTQQPVIYGQPQIIGYDQSGMPIYGQPQVQPMMYGQPQIIGYDQSGMPIYGQPQVQPMMYSQPQIIGYDQSGKPIYGQPQVQPMMYGQPQIIGYDQSGMPIYGQPNIQPQMQQPMSGIPMQGIPAIPPQNTPKPETPKKDDKQAFWDFFDEGSKKPADHSKQTNDFFGKAEPEPINPEDPFADIDNRRKKRLQGQSDSGGVMSDMPVVDGSKLEKNDSSRINNLYMRQIKDSVSDDLTVGTGKSNSGTMDETREVDASLLSENLNVKSRISMGFTEDVNADDIKQAVNEHKEAIMAKADHAVEAMPKKINPYESELDKIELPEYMQSKKTVHEKAAEIPSLPEV